jgi:poly(ADP-ribose) glycohydrolase
MQARGAAPPPPLPCDHACRRDVAELLRTLAADTDAGAPRGISSGARLVAAMDELREVLGKQPLSERAAAGLSGFFDAPSPLPPPRAGWLLATLPSVLRLAARLPDALALAPAPLAHLRSGQRCDVSVPRAAAAALLASAFLTLTHEPRPGGWSDDEEEDVYDEDGQGDEGAAAAAAAAVAATAARFCFLGIYNELAYASQRAKLDCLLHYLSRVAPAPPAGALRFSRLLLHAPAPHADDWCACAAPLLPLHVHASPGAALERSAAALKADFANRRLGGGALGSGCVQEEILFMTHPELCVGMLLAAPLRDDEALLLRGATRFSAHEGYRHDFTWAGDASYDAASAEGEDDDASGTTTSAPPSFVAFDALFDPGEAQFGAELLVREANKALVAFTADAPGVAPGGAVATGNWGAGAFRGDLPLKALLQWCAASRAGRAVEYYPFGDTRAEPLASVCEHVRHAMRIATVGQLFQALRRYGDVRRSSGGMLAPHETDVFVWLAAQRAA